MQNKPLVCKIQTVPKTIHYAHLHVSWTDNPTAYYSVVVVVGGGGGGGGGLSVVGRLLLLLVLLLY
jgi:hypothetical protein